MSVVTHAELIPFLLLSSVRKVNDICALSSSILEEIFLCMYLTYRGEYRSKNGTRLFSQSMKCLIRDSINNCCVPITLHPLDRKLAFYRDDKLVKSTVSLDQFH